MRHLYRVAIAVPLLSLVTCLDATEVRITVVSDICELHAVDLFLGNNSTVAIAHVDVPLRTDCQPGVFTEQRIGDIVFVPAKANERRFTVQARGERAGGMCPSKGCVTASRNIAYLEHTSLALDIALDHDCIDVPCDPGTTCVHGLCQNNRVDCMDKTCMDGGSTADVMRSDVSSIADVETDIKLFDSATACLNPPRIANLGSPALYWNMDGPDLMTIVEQVSGLKSTVVMGNIVSTLNAYAGCGKNLTIPMKQPVLPKQMGNGIGLSAWVYVAQNAQPVSQILIKETGTQAQGASIIVDNLYRIQVVTRDATGSSGNWTTNQSLTTNAWHSIEVYLASQTPIKVYVDGSLANGAGAVNMGAFGSGGLSFGPALNYALDEVRIFDLP